MSTDEGRPYIDRVFEEVRTDPWQQRPENQRLIREIRDKLADGTTNLLVFLGAGLSFGVDRGRTSFELFEHDEYFERGRFPSWNGLMKRMLRRLEGVSTLEQYKAELKAFFAEQGPLDCAEFFRMRLGDTNYYSFLRDQFGSKPDDNRRLTASHAELVRLPVQHIFTTNFDELIELAFRTAGQQVRVSASPSEFVSQAADRSLKHIIKLNGSVNQPSSIVLTRSEYARSRRGRADMLAYLAHELRYSAFLFIGFSLSDPNFGVLHDEARLATRGELPVSYVVQGFRNVVKEDYLQALGVNTITLNLWDQLPEFFRAINP